MFSFSHRRFNTLTGEWVLVSPHRSKRSWMGQVEMVPLESLAAYDPDCYLCQGNPRSSVIMLAVARLCEMSGTVHYLTNKK